MYSTFRLAKKYLHYYFTASNGKGHRIHSPFIFDFIKNVLRDKREYDCYKTIENLRAKLLQNNTLINVEDHGAGSSVISSNKRVVKDIARSSLKNKKFAQLFYRLVKYYKPETIVELGTSFGITTSYMAFSNPSSTVYTVEGAENIALIAQNNFEKLGLKNIQLIKANFNEALPSLLQQKINKVDLVFIDGHHLKLPTLQYFTWLLEKSTERSIFIFDDIHWSAEMEEAWNQIQYHSRVTLTIDLFFIGIVFFNKDFKAKQHFVIRF